MLQMLQQPKYKKKGSLVHSNRTAASNEFTNTMLFPSIGTAFPSILWSGQKNDDNSIRNDVGFYHNPVCTNVIQGAFDDSEQKGYNNEGVYRVLLKIIEKHEYIDEIKNIYLPKIFMNFMIPYCIRANPIVPKLFIPNVK